MGWCFFCCGGSVSVEPKERVVAAPKVAEPVLLVDIRESIGEARKSCSEALELEALDAILECTKIYFQSRAKFLEEKKEDDLLDMLKQYEFIVESPNLRQYCPWRIFPWLRDDLRKRFDVFKHTPTGFQLIQENDRVASFLFNAGMVRYTREGSPEFISSRSSISLEQ